MEQYWGESSLGTWLGEALKTARDTIPQAEGGVCTEPWRREAAWLAQGTTACSVAVTATSQFMLLSTKVGKVIIPLKGHDNMLRSLQWVITKGLSSHRNHFLFLLLKLKVPKGLNECACITISSETAFGENFNNAAMRAWSEAAESLLLLQITSMSFLFHVFIFKFKKMVMTVLFVIVSQLWRNSLSLLLRNHCWAHHHVWGVQKG